MYLDSKILSKFVMQEPFNNGRITITNQTETKVRGRHTGASPAVRSGFCLDGSCSDLPSLFNQIPFIMQEPMDKCGQCPDRPLTAESIIHELVTHAPMEDFGKGLHDLFISWVQCEDLTKGEYKDKVIYTYTCLKDLIESVDKLQKSKKS